MISGPVLALTPEGVREQLRRDRDCIESGLELVRDGVQTSDGLRLDGLARDGRGKGVVLLFALDGRHPASRVLGAREFLRRSGRALCRALGEPQLVFDENTRLFVIGSGVPDDWVADLERLGLPQLELWDLDAVFVQGARQLLVRPMLGHAAAAIEDRCTAPSGADGTARRLADDLLRLVERLDPAIVATGDRFRRTLTWQRVRLADVRVDGDRLRCVVGEGDDAETFVLRRPDDVAAAADGILRAYLGLAAADGLAEHEPAREPARRAPERLPSFAALRQSAARAQVSQDEFQMLARGGDLGAVPQRAQDSVAGSP